MHSLLTTSQVGLLYFLYLLLTVCKYLLLSVVCVTGQIIWADARLDYIATTDLDGNGLRYIMKNSQLPHIFAITQFEDYIFWTDWETKTVERARKVMSI